MITRRTFCIALAAAIAPAGEQIHRGYWVDGWGRRLAQPTYRTATRYVDLTGNADIREIARELRESDWRATGAAA